MGVIRDVWPWSIGDKCGGKAAELYDRVDASKACDMGLFFLMLMSFLDEFTKSILVARFRAAILRVSEEAKIVSTSCEKDLRYRSDNTLGSIFGVSALKDEELE